MGFVRVDGGGRGYGIPAFWGVRGGGAVIFTVVTHLININDNMPERCSWGTFPPAGALKSS